MQLNNFLLSLFVQMRIQSTQYETVFSTFWRIGSSTGMKMKFSTPNKRILNVENWFMQSKKKREKSF